MDPKHENHIINRLRNPYPADPSLEEHVKSVIKSPRAKQSFNLLGPVPVDELLIQYYQTDWGTLWVRRNGCVVNIGWGMRFDPKWPRYYPVFGCVYEIAFTPSQASNLGGLFYTGVGADETAIELEEGNSYLFVFHFVTIGHGDEKVLAESVASFQMSVPLSGDSKILLANARKGESDPGVKVRHELQQLLAAQDAVEDAQQEARQRIVAKGLPPEEEERRIIEVSEYTRFVKEKLGL